MRLSLTLLLCLSTFVSLSVHSFQSPQSSSAARKSRYFPSIPSSAAPFHINRQNKLSFLSSSPEAQPDNEKSCEGSDSSRLEEHENEKSTAMFSKLIAKIGSTTSLLVAGTFYAILCYKRDAFMVAFFIGAILNGILSKVLKRVLGVSRPEALDPTTLDLAPSDNGMPSSHAMSLGFIGTFTALTLPQTTIPLLIYCLVSLIYRVQSNLHTIEQIGVGAVLGTLNGALWWKLCTGGVVLGDKLINIVDRVAASSIIIDPHTRLLPWYMLSVPALIGAAVVGSVERRLQQFLNKRKGTKEA